MTWNLVNQELKPAFEILSAGRFKNKLKMNNTKTDITVIFLLLSPQASH